MACSPKNIIKKVPIIKNGPNGISDFIVFFLKIIKPTPTMAPRRKARKRAIKTYGQPRKSPIKKANFMSPIPIPLPLVIKTINRKNPPAIKEAYIVFNIS